MEKFYEIYDKYKMYFIGLFLFLVLIVSEALLFGYFSDNLNMLKSDIKNTPVVSEVKEDKGQFVVDIKGEVKNPGVYFLDEGKRVIDVVKKAGGFTKDADSSANNLSMKIKDEMVIVIYSKDEIEDFASVLEEEKAVAEACASDIIENDSCITEETIKDSKKVDVSDNSSFTDDEITTGKVSLNNATLEELMTLPGIGEAKANSIIEYRKEQKFEKIEDIMNVSGIGEAIFEKLKEYITT